MDGIQERMTLWDWLGSGQGGTLVAALAALLAALAGYLKTRTTDGKVDTIKVLVNGKSTRQDSRISQLEQHLADNGIAVPPTPMPELPDDAGELPLIPPPPSIGGTT